MNQIMLQVLRFHERKLQLPERATLTWKKEYGDIFSYIRENYKTVTMEELAEKFHYSKRQLIRIIKSTSGRGFHEMIRDMKLSRAKKNLEETNVPTEEPGFLCGYKNFAAFSRAFKKSEGMTPSEYRKNCN